MRQSANTRRIIAAAEAGYRVDDEGRVFSPRGTQRKLRADTRGYLVFSIGKDGSCVCVHMLQAYQRFGAGALAWGMQVRHLDGNRQNNAAWNIAVGDQSANQLDRNPNERRVHALKAAKARRRLSPGDACAVVARSRQGESGRSLARSFGVSPSTISEILSGKLYSEATGIAFRPRSPVAISPAHCAAGATQRHSSAAHSAPTEEGTPCNGLGKARALLGALALLFVGCIEVEERRVCYPPSINRELGKLITGCLEGRGDSELFHVIADELEASGFCSKRLQYRWPWNGLPHWTDCTEAPNGSDAETACTEHGGNK